MRLPTELILQICSIAAHSSQECACALARVSSWTHDVAAKALYEVVVLRKWRNVDAFVRSLDEYNVNGNRHRVRAVWLPSQFVTTPARLHVVKQTLSVFNQLSDLAIPASYLPVALGLIAPIHHLTVTTPPFRYDWDAGLNSSFKSLSNITHLVILRTDAESYFLPLSQMSSLTHLAYPMAPGGHGTATAATVEASTEDILSSSKALGEVAKRFLSSSRVHLQMLVLHFDSSARKGRKGIRGFARELGLQLQLRRYGTLEDGGIASDERIPRSVRTLVRTAHACDSRLYALPLEFGAVLNSCPESPSRTDETSNARRIWENGRRASTGGQGGFFERAVKILRICGGSELMDSS